MAEQPAPADSSVGYQASGAAQTGSAQGEAHTVQLETANNSGYTGAAVLFSGQNILVVEETDGHRAVACGQIQ